MPFRTAHSYTTAAGTTVIRGKSGQAKKSMGSAPAPAGTKHVSTPSYKEAPTVTVTPSGSVTTSGFSDRQAARSAVRQTKAHNRRIRAILHTHFTSPQKRSQRFKAPPSPKPSPPSPNSKPKVFQTHRTAGEPTRSELSSAAKAGTLKLNQAGFATTPKVRQAAKALHTAQAKVAKTGIEAPLAPEQKRFVKGVAKHTGLSPKAVAAQALAEQSGPAATSYEASGEHNYLNIGPGQHFPSNRQAVAETSKLLNTSSNYAGIRAAKGHSPLAQVRAIGASPWGTNQSVMEQTLGEVRVKQNPKAAKQLQQAKAQAEEVGLHPGQVGPPPKQLVTKFKAALKTMSAINSRHMPYVWGGGHGTFEGPYDCSGAVSALIHSVAPNVLKAPLVSGSMGQALKSGPGAITVFYNSVHTFAYIPSLHKYWGTSESNPGGGAGFFPKSVGDSEVASGNSAGSYSVGHIPGLGRKQALQLGASPTDLGGTSSFPGMTLSPSGTTATINSGAGATVGSPGFSAKPIKLTPRQRVHRAEVKLKALSAPKAEAESTSSVTIKDLEKKYGHAVV